MRAKRTTRGPLGAALPLGLAVGLTLGFAASAAAEPVTYRLDPAASRLEVKTETAGMLSGLAHEHIFHAPRFRGVVVYDADDPGSSTVELTIETPAIDLATEGVPADDRAEILERMRTEVLKVTDHPEIRFTSSRVAALTGGIRLTGWLRIVGRPVQVSFNVALRREGDTLEARGNFRVKQTDFGIAPVSIGLGTIRVADELTFRFIAVGRRAEPGDG
jgi:polyisoprenoid-binding protein YceI